MMQDRRRAPAEAVTAWYEQLVLPDPGSEDHPYVVLAVANSGSSPVFQVLIQLSLGARGTFVRVLRSLGPGQEWEIPIPLPAPPGADPIAPALSFLDPRGQHWYRAADGALRTIEPIETMTLMAGDAGAYSEDNHPDGHPTMDLHTSDPRWQARRRDHS